MDSPHVFYKTMNGTSGAYGYGEWSLPRGNRPGKWMPKVKPVLCESGYHVCRDLREVLIHLGPDLYEVEVRGAHVDGDDKAAWEQARLICRIPGWNETTLRLFAVDCARSAVNRYADASQRDLLHACLDVIVGWAHGYCDSAALAAASAAALTAACDPARAAAWDAARAAARAAAWDAASDAALDAARDAAFAAAWDAARDAAFAAAWDAARAAALDAARDEQATIMARYLAGEQGPFINEGDA